MTAMIVIASRSYVLVCSVNAMQKKKQYLQYVGISNRTNAVGYSTWLMLSISSTLNNATLYYNVSFRVPEALLMHYSVYVYVSFCRMCILFCFVFLISNIYCQVLSPRFEQRHNGNADTIAASDLVGSWLWASLCMILNLWCYSFQSINSF